MKIEIDWDAGDWPYGCLNKLTKIEILHLLVDVGCTSPKSFKRTRLQHKEDRAKFGCEPCWTCNDIARKLKLEV